VVKAMAIVERPTDGALLVTEYVDPARRRFQRPPGGTVEFGELATEAIVREIREEFELELTDTELLGALENRFAHEGRSGHEIVLVVRASFADPSAYDFVELAHLDTPGVRAGWRRRGADRPNLVPEGIERFLAE
jgi:ADP-ribose pyrophosphatase YjhB (NUDIX family)